MLEGTEEQKTENTYVVCNTRGKWPLQNSYDKFHARFVINSFPHLQYSLSIFYMNATIVTLTILLLINFKKSVTDYVIKSFFSLTMLQNNLRCIRNFNIFYFLIKSVLLSSINHTDGNV
jgi:hypothetical protein